MNAIQERIQRKAKTLAIGHIFAESTEEQNEVVLFDALTGSDKKQAEEMFQHAALCERWEYEPLETVAQDLLDLFTLMTQIVSYTKHSIHGNTLLLTTAHMKPEDSDALKNQVASENKRVSERATGFGVILYNDEPESNRNDAYSEALNKILIHAANEGYGAVAFDRGVSETLDDEGLPLFDW